MKNRPDFQKTASIFCMAGLSGLLLQGCNDSDSEGGTASSAASTPTATTSTPATSESTTTLKVAGSRMGSSGDFIPKHNAYDLAVGAPDASGGKGAVLFIKSTESDFSSYLLGDVEGDNFGSQVTYLGDLVGDGGQYLAVGAKYATGETPLSGAVYIYRLTATTPERIATLRGQLPLDKFGSAMTTGDFNHDGIRDLAVSAIHTYTAEAGFQAGAVSVWFGGTSLNRVADVVISGSKVNDGIGAALAAGDINGDGKSDLFVSASSKVLVFYGGSQFDHVPDLTIRSDIGGKGGSGFGSTLAFAGDVNGDGIGDIVIGNPNRSVPANYDNQGSVYIFRGFNTQPENNEIWEDQSNYRLTKIVGAAPMDRFGSSVAVTDNGSLLVGARWASGGTPSAPLAVTGNVYRFELTTQVANPATLHTANQAVQTYPIVYQSGEFGHHLALGGAHFFSGTPSLHENQGRVYRKLINGNESDDGSCCG